MSEDRKRYKCRYRAMCIPGESDLDGANDTWFVYDSYFGKSTRVNDSKEAFATCQMMNAIENDEVLS